MSEAVVRSETPAPGVRYLVLNQPETRNALSDALLDRLISELERARDDDAVRVVVITSSHDRVFSAGGDLRAFEDDRPISEKHRGLSRFPRLFQLLGALGKPVICAANGDVIAGAFGLALACDLVIAKESARFGCPEINVGVFPFMISTLIYRNIDRMKANELMMVGELITASVAQSLGCVNRVVSEDEFDDAVLEWATAIAGKSPLLMRFGKEAIDATRDLPLGAALEVMQARLALALTTEDAAEGIRARREKRAPRWRMR